MQLDGEASEKVFLAGQNGRLTELSDASDLIRSLRNRPISVERLCYPGELREPLRKLLQS